MKDKDTIKIWIAAVREFDSDIHVKLPCPSCQNGNLLVKDIPFDSSDREKGGERIIYCDMCFASKIVLLRKPPPNWCSLEN